MNNKEKYEQALERARAEYNNHLEPGYEDYRRRLESIFPELRKSEDERIRNEIIDHLVKEVGLHPGEDRKEHRWLRWLEKQKEQKPAEWSEEDEKKMIFLERLIEYNIPDGQYGWADGRKGGFVKKSEAISMLKSLRPSWKPSEEQMRILNWAANGIVDNCIAAPEMRAVLRELYNDLKKLKGGVAPMRDIDE